MTNFKTNKLFNGIKQLLDTNAPTLATFGSVLGLGLTIYFMHKASKQAAKVEEKYEEDIQDLEDQKAIEGVDEGGISEEEFKSEKARIKTNKYIRLVYIYRWALISGFASGGLAFLSNYLNGRTIATITGLLALNQEKLKEYAEKGKEMLGSEKFEELRDEVNKELFNDKLRKGEVKHEKSKESLALKNDNPPWGEYEVFVVPDYDALWEIPSGLMRKVVDECNQMFKDDPYAYLDFNAFRRKLRFVSTRGWENLKWDQNNPFKAHIASDVNYGDGSMRALIFDNLPNTEASLTR